jgi:hypothetical protein
VSTVFASQVQDGSCGLMLLCCPRCEASLTVHQPDPMLADRLLATCDDCKAWYLTDEHGSELRFIAGPRIGVARINGS